MRDPKSAVPTIGVRLASALISGQVAGLLMALFLMAVSVAVLHRSVLFPVQLIASLLLGHDALSQPSSGVIATGLLFHQLGPSLAWSLVFFTMLMFLRERISLNTSLMMGFLLALTSMIVDVFLIAPPLQKLTSGENLWTEHLALPWHWAAHMLYGLSLGPGYWAVRAAIEKRRGVARRIHVPTTVSADEAGVTRTSDGHNERLH